jgi:hypothetical protein
MALSKAPSQPNPLLPGVAKIHAIDARLLAHFQGNAALLRMLDVQCLEHLSLEMERGAVESSRKPAQLPAWQQANPEAVVATADPSTLRDERQGPTLCAARDA